MPRAKENKLYRTFVKGLITEAGFLTYPEDASSSEMNTLLSRKGNRSRRLGIDFQEGYDLEPVGVSLDVATTEYVWDSVNNDSDVTFVCVQVGSTVHFYRMNNEPLSTQKADFSIDLQLFRIPTASASEFPNEYVSFSSGSGFLFIAHKHMDPVSVEYKPTSDALTVIPIVIQIRDLEGVYDGLANDEEPSTLSPQHHYNLLNQGWVSPGSRTIDISTPSYPAPPSEPGTDSPLPSPGESVYYNPYTGGTDFYKNGKVIGGFDS